MRWHLTAALFTLGIVAIAPPALSKPLTDRTHRFAIDVDANWSRQHKVPSGTVAVFTNPKHGLQLAIARVNHPNRAAWRSRAWFFASVEQGVQRAATKYKRLHRKRHKLGRVPALDIEYRHRGQEELVTFSRFLFFRRYSLVLSISVPAQSHGRQKKRMKAIVGSFRPYFGN